MQVTSILAWLSLVVALAQCYENHQPLIGSHDHVVMEQSNKVKPLVQPFDPSTGFMGQPGALSRDIKSTHRQESGHTELPMVLPGHLEGHERVPEVSDRRSRDASSEAMPALPKSFVTRVEITKSESNRHSVLQGEEKFDGVLNKGVLIYKTEQSSIANPHTVEKIVQYSISEDKSLLINEVKKGPDCQEKGSACRIEKDCSASDIAGANAYLYDFFGYVNSDRESGLLGVTGLLQWGPEYGVKYLGVAECRGMLCDKWETDNRYQSAHIIFYWSSKKFMVNEEMVQVPIAIEMTWYNIYSMAHRYDFYEFHGGERPEAKDITPDSNLFCQNRTSFLQPPPAPHTFHYKAELSIGPQRIEGQMDARDLVNIGRLLYHTEFYDWDKKLTMLEYTPFVQENEESYDYQINEINDFNQGLTYLVRPHLNNECSINAMRNNSMKRPALFTYMDEPLQYNGLHTIRGMQCEAFVGQRTMPNTNNYNETFVFYYETSSSDGVSSMQGRQITERRPVRFERYSELAFQTTYMQYNIYQYDDIHPMTHTLDVSSCYDPSDRRHFIVDLPADTLPSIHHELQKLLYFSQGELAVVANISALRINRISIEVRPEGPRLLFTVLGKPKLDVVPDAAQQEASLDEAVNKLQAAVDDGKIFIMVSVGFDAVHPGEPLIVIVRPVPSSMQEVTRANTKEYSYEQSRGYESGDMAGLAFGLLAVGVLLSVVAGFAYKKYISPGVVTLPRVQLAHSQNTTGSMSTIALDHDLTASNI